jgi:hypothetical protein
MDLKMILSLKGGTLEERKNKVKNNIKQYCLMLWGKECQKLEDECADLIKK